MFENLSEKLEGAFKSLRGDGKLTELNIANSIKKNLNQLVTNIFVKKYFNMTNIKQNSSIKLIKKKQFLIAVVMFKDFLH